MTRLVTSLLVLIGLALVAVGIVYFTVKAGSLPSFFPGHIAHSSAHRNKHALVAVIAGVVVLVLAVMLPSFGGARHRRH
jgi:multisubunit Na+/H+ antiporter MnhB subunit